MNYNSTNPSAPYGYYGSVAPGEVYFPPETYALAPMPKTVPFTNEHLALLSTLTASEAFKSFLKANAGSILLRNLIGSHNNEKVFELITLADLENLITYSTALSSITIALLPTSTVTLSFSGVWNDLQYWNDSLIWNE